MNFDSGPYLCVGADPHRDLLLEYRLNHSVNGLRQFGYLFLDALPEEIKIVKPQVSLYESFGSKGFHELEILMSELKKMGKYVIADVKRSDIGSSMAGYTQAWLSDFAPFFADAITVSPYLGVDTFKETFELALKKQKRVFVLVATSNPEARTLQAGGLAAKVLKDIGKYDPGSIGVVVGATVDTAEYGISEPLSNSELPILAPGFGAQGASLSNASEIFAGSSERLIANVSRSVLSGDPRLLRKRMDEAVSELA
ncbi:MAG TPA: orotidine-5'-phosphate decarboxylase [Microbacteriaceae bacterium]